MKKVGSFLNLLVALSMVFAFFAVQPAAASPAHFPKEPGAPQPPPKQFEAVFNDETLLAESA